MRSFVHVAVLLLLESSGGSAGLPSEGLSLTTGSV